MMKKGFRLFVLGGLLVLLGILGIVFGAPYLKAYKSFRDMNLEC